MKQKLLKLHSGVVKSDPFHLHVNPSAFFFISLIIWLVFPNSFQKLKVLATFTRVLERHFLGNFIIAVPSRVSGSFSGIQYDERLGVTLKFAGEKVF